MLSATSSVSAKVQLPSQEDIYSVMSIAQMELYDLDESSFKDELSLVIRRDITIDDMTLSPISSFSKSKRPKSACCANTSIKITDYDSHDLYDRFFARSQFRRKNDNRDNSLLTLAVDKAPVSAAR